MSQQSNDEKTVYLVRHAQSEQNIATARLEKGDVGALGDLVRLGFDAPVSAEGRQQLTTAARSLDGFATQQKIEIVAHSPYQRAVTTAMALFSGHHRPLELLPPLHERTIAEYLFPSHSTGLRLAQRKRRARYRACGPRPILQALHRRARRCPAECVHPRDEIQP